jgi:hypothetical protein
MQKDIENYIPKCRSCQKNKHAVPNTKMEVEISNSSSVAFDKILMYCDGALRLTGKGSKLLFCIVSFLAMVGR